MRRARNGIGILMLTAGLLIGSTVTSVSSVWAAAEGQENQQAVYGPQVYVTEYEVTSEAIIPEEPFQLTVTVHNFSKTETAKDTSLYINNPDGVIPVYGSVTQTAIGEIKPGENKKISFSYESLAEIDQQYLNFYVNLIWEGSTSTSEVRIPVSRNTDFIVDEISLPDRWITGQEDVISTIVENRSQTSLNHVVLRVKCDGEEIASSVIGTMDSDAVKSEQINLKLSDAGVYDMKVLLSYTTADGDKKEYQVGSKTIEVSETTTGAMTGSEMKLEQQAGMESAISTHRKLLTVVISIALMVIVGALTILLLRRRR